MSDLYDDGDDTDDVQDFDGFDRFENADGGYIDPDTSSVDDMPLDDDFASESSPDDDEPHDFSLHQDYEHTEGQEIDYELNPDEQVTEEAQRFEQVDDVSGGTEQATTFEREKSQDELIAEAEPSKKTAYHENKARMFDRTKLTLIVFGVLVFLILFFTLVLPELMPKKKKADKGLEKAGAVYIPSELDSWKPDEPEFKDSNSAIDVQKEDVPDLADKFPPPVEERRAPIAATQNAAPTASVSVPLTNRNEQQKQFFGVELDTKRGGYPVTASQKSTGSYSYSGYAGTASAGYTPSAVSANMDKYLASVSGQRNSYEMQNMQSNKQDFMGNASGQTGTYQWNGDFALWKGTVIPAVLETGIDTDLPGVVIATVTTNVYSSKDGRYVLIPQGSKLFAVYNSSVSYGQNRVQVAWNTLIRPDGLEINLGNLQGVDMQGFAGYKGSVSNHPFEFAKALGLIAMFSLIDTKMDNTIDTAGNQYAQNVMAETYSEVQKLNNKIIDRALDIQPTIKIKGGTKVNLITNVTIDLPPAETIPVEGKYERKN